MAGDLRIAAAVMAAPLGRTADNFERTAELARQARDAGAHLVCFPEMNLTGYSTRQTVRAQAQSLAAPLVGRLEALAADTCLMILAGLAEVDAHGRLFASQLVTAPGQPPAVYRKTHVAPPERDIFSAGDDLPLFTVNGWRFGIQLCYDAHFPELSTRMALDGAEVIFLPHASPRGTPQEKLTSWCRHLQARAFDNGVFVVACNQSGRNGEGLEFPGVAVAIGPGGQILAQDVSGQEGLLCVDLKRAELEAVRGHRMRYFLPNRRPDLYSPPLDQD
ncbi:MAG: nitrilase-related carbon-nitrogen hydrolase [Desulfobacterales bacterium]|nr:nitrilase-related carbon-nitrogen hydrolase [Desulfobacterales bacterium]MDJ0886491.1 nitrilase-related carbon-nitrogen hydrolase [Desulfobacterales bacterium]